MKNIYSNLKYILLGIILILIILSFFFISRDNRMQIKWQIASKDTVITSEEWPCELKVIFLWQGDTYEGSNCRYGSYKTPEGTQEGPIYAFFILKKNNQIVLSLDKEKNEMRGFRFFNCGSQLCIFGRNMGKSHDITGLNPTPDIDLNLLLWPSGKRLSFSNPCKTRQVANYDVNQLNTNNFIITLFCPGYYSGDPQTYYRGEVVIKNK